MKLSSSSLFQNFVPVVAQSPMQLVEVGFSEKTNKNGFHDSEDGALTVSFNRKKLYI